MSLTRSQMDAELQKLYDQIPEIPDCDGRCWQSCGPVGMSDRERQRIRQAGVRIAPYEQAMAAADTYWCEALTGGKRCAVYEMRPIICRLWGAVEGMPCVFGCIPEGGWLSDEEGRRLIAASLAIGGGGIPRASAEVNDAIGRARLMTEAERIRDPGMLGGRIRMTDGVPAAFRRR
jgi:Fe-S-cluster containining protein